MLADERICHISGLKVQKMPCKMKGEHIIQRDCLPVSLFSLSDVCGFFCHLSCCCSRLSLALSQITSAPCTKQTEWPRDPDPQTTQSSVEISLPTQTVKTTTGLDILPLDPFTRVWTVS